MFVCFELGSGFVVQVSFELVAVLLLQPGFLACTTMPNFENVFFLKDAYSFLEQMKQQFLTVTPWWMVLSVVFRCLCALRHVSVSAEPGQGWSVFSHKTLEQSLSMGKNSQFTGNPLISSSGSSLAIFI